MKPFLKSISFCFGLGALRQTTENVRPIQRPFWCLHLFVDSLFWLYVIQKHGIHHILRTTEQKRLPAAIERSPPWGFAAQSILHQRSTVEVRKVLFLRESHLQGLLRLS